MMKNLSVTCGVLLAGAALQIPAPVRAASLSLVPAASEVALGESIAITLQISDLGSGEAPSLGAFDITLAFDDTILDLSAVTFGDPITGDGLDFLGIGSISGVDPVDASRISLFGISLNPASTVNEFQPDTFTLATLTFETRRTGTSLLRLLGEADGFAPLLGDADGEPIVDIATVDGMIAVTAGDNSRSIPEPNVPVLWFGLALFGLCCRRAIAR